MKSDILLATRPIKGIEAYGLITVQYEIPLYLHTELLTHRLFARNCSSARAMSTKRYAAMGYYVPPIFYKGGQGMQASHEPIAHQGLARMIVTVHWNLSTLAAYLLERLDVAKEQRNRIIPPNKYVRGIVTGTETAWSNFFRLRNNVAADSAMQVFARKLQTNIALTTWRYDTSHIPLYPHDLNPEPRVTHNMHELKQIAMARIARVSYLRDKGKNDLELAERLIAEGHLSPAEHIAEWKIYPITCAFNVQNEDNQQQYGWESYRSAFE